ncbi:MAG: hypothetical protein JKY94_04525 [Rhodobacteraceae bacterium]|nr:hypothetical protein [Paracoccaceae bacterium]
MRKFVPLVLPLIGALAAYAVGLTLTLGAHPWWAGKVILFGFGFGLLLAAALWGLRLSKLIRLISLTVLTLAAFSTATIGKTRFAASYAEDVLGGQMWYFGWMATCTFALALLATLAWPTRRYH